jgi:hypothetical protein
MMFDHAAHAKNIQRQQLHLLGIPWELASKCSEILAHDDSAKENLGRTPEEQELIESAYDWMKSED